MTSAHHWTRAAAALAATSLMLAAGCGHKPEASGAPGAGGAADPPKKADAGVVVTVAEAARGSIDRTVDVTGSLVALQDVVVGAKSAGRIATVLLHEGDPVQAGQLVAEMDSADLKAQVESANATVEAAITKEQQAHATLQQ